MVHIAFRVDDLYFYALVNLGTNEVKLIMESKDSPFIDREEDAIFHLLLDIPIK
jgi:hypothetical protein